MPSKYYERFRESFFQPRKETWREGPDLEAVRHLHDEERDAAEQDLLEAISPDDDWIVRALGELESTRAVPLLKPLLRHHGLTAVAAAEALWKIEQYTDSAAIIADHLRYRWWKSWCVFSSSGWPVRMEAAIALGSVGGPVAVQALTRALKDPKFLVRHHAQEALENLEAVRES